VLVIPEDFRKDQHILKPIVSAMLDALSRRKAVVRVCQDPLLGGVAEALKWDRIAEILDRYKGMTDLFLLCIDRDGDIDRRAKLDHIEGEAARVLPRGCGFFAEHAWQELEVWLLAGHDRRHGWVWSEVRDELHPKERYYLPLARNRGLLQAPAEGRGVLGAEAARRYSRIRQLCPEVANLENRAAQWLQPGA
jgi:hypothetical protein